MMRSFLFLLCASTAITGCGAPSNTAQTPATAEATTKTTRKDSSEAHPKSDQQSLTEHLDQFWEDQVALSPEYQTRLGRKTNYDRWDDRSPEADDRSIALLRTQLADLQTTFDRDSLSKEDRLNYDLFVRNTEDALARDVFRLQHYPLSQFRGIHTSIPVFLANFHRIDTIEDARAYIARVNAVDKVLDQAANALQLRLEAGFALPEFSYPLIADAAANARDGNAVRADFEKKITELDLDTEKTADLLSSFEEALSGPYAAGYTTFEARVRDMAQATTDTGNLGVARFDPDGSFYEALLRHYTTTDLTAEEIHDLGLNEVARIQDEMRIIMKSVNFEGSLEDFFVFMQTDKQFYLPDMDEGRQNYLDTARNYIEDFMPRLDELFTIRPQASVEVRRVEPFRERSAGKAFYSQPDERGTRPGYFYANLASMEDMPLYQLEALVYHEAIPGHHMQRALQIEQTDLPMFRRFGGTTAYTEGWGLYSELLPKEIGYYQDPYSDFGRLAMELWRAARLVVDTGLHHKGWSMGQAIAYLQQNTPNPKGDTVKAIERYIVYPGQATAYKIGMLQILALRTKAQAELGDQFDIRGFHDTILRAGPLPLDILEQQIDAWIASERA